MPRTSRKPPPPTLVLLVRHGQTPTTGERLPGRAPGLHLADEGRAQAEAVGRAHRRAAQGRRGLRLAARAHARDRGAHRASAADLQVTIERGLLECDFGDWTGGELKKLRKEPEWRTVQRYPSGFRFPDGESFAEMQARIVGALERLRRAHPGGTVVAVVARRSRSRRRSPPPLGTHLDLFQRIVISPVLGHRHRLRRRRARRPRPSTPSTTSRRSSRHDRPPWMSTSFELDDVDHLTTGTVGPPGQRVFYLQAAPGRPAGLAAAGEDAGRRARALPRRAARRPAAGRARCPTDLELREPVVAEWVVGGPRRGVRRGRRPRRAPGRGAASTAGADDEERGERARRVARFGATREQVAAFAMHGAGVVEAGRPPCPLCGQPARSGGTRVRPPNGHRPRTT